MTSASKSYIMSDEDEYLVLLEGGDLMRLSRNTNQPVARNIKRIIDDNGLKQGFVAKKANIPEKRFSDMLNSRQIIRPCDVVAIAAALSVDTSTLFVI